MEYINEELFENIEDMDNTSEIEIDLENMKSEEQEMINLNEISFIDTKDMEVTDAPKFFAPVQKFQPKYINISEFSYDEIKEYWFNLFGDYEFSDSETVRLVYFAKSFDGNNDVNVTTKIQINSVDSLIKAMDVVYGQFSEKNKDGTYKQNKSIGFSLGSGIYEFDKAGLKAPGRHSFKYLKTIIMDVDCYVYPNVQKERFVLSVFDKKQQAFAAMQIYNKICDSLLQYSSPLIIPYKVYCTGGGFQFLFTFDKFLSMSEVEPLFDMYKTVFTKTRFPVMGVGSLSLIGEAVSDFYAEIDLSFTDVVHVQRLFGVKNQKYGFRPTDISTIFGNNIKSQFPNDKFNINIITSNHFAEKIESYFLYNEINKSIHAKTSPDEESVIYGTVNRFCDNKREEKTTLIKKIDNIISNFSVYLKSSLANPITIPELQTFSKMIIKPKSVIEKASNVKDIQLNEILYKISGQVAINILKHEISFINETGNLIACKCPFHGDEKSSFAIYKNENGKTILMDFHDNKSYDIIEFWMAHKNLDKQTAINDLVSKSGLIFNSKDGKSLQKVIGTTSVNDLIKQIDVENFIYYRLTNKQKSCIVRHINTGEPFLFDGSKMLADHILDNQLQKNDADAEFREIFHAVFEEKVLLEAFEEYSPGQKSTFSRDFVQFVNTWIPGKNYKEVHKIAENLTDMDIDLTLSLLREKTPHLYIYLLQITQKGNLKYFVNWLAASSQFRIMPIMPIMTSNFGTGKNLFVEEVLNFYFNQEYVNVMNSDRVQSQFNSLLETCSLLVLDEGDFSKSKEVDNLKFLTGNNTLMIEKKGVDTVKKKKMFNTIMLTNGDSPINHPYNERRFTYYRLDVSLLDTCNALKTTIPDLIDKVREELVDFWAIIYKTIVIPDWAFQNDKSPQYFKQILMMHPFGRLVIKMIEEQWVDLSLQLNEHNDDQITQANNTKLINDLRDQFKLDGRLNMVIVNKYIKSMNYKHFQSVQNFIQINQLKNHGFNILIENNNTYVVLDIEKIKKTIYMDNNLKEVIPDYFIQIDEENSLIKNKENGIMDVKKPNEFKASDTKPILSGTNIPLSTEEKELFYNPAHADNEENNNIFKMYNAPKIPGK